MSCGCILSERERAALVRFSAGHGYELATLDHADGRLDMAGLDGRFLIGRRVDGLLFLGEVPVGRLIGTFEDISDLLAAVPATRTVH